MLIKQMLFHDGNIKACDVVLLMPSTTTMNGPSIF